MRVLTKTEIQKINKTALANKHNTSQQYVSEILYGVKKANSPLAKAIVADALKILDILIGEPVAEDQTQEQKSA